MKQKPAVFLLALSILAYAFLLSFAVYRIIAARGAAIRESEADFASLTRLSGSALAQGRDFGSKIFIEQMRTRYALTPRLLAVTVRDQAGKLGYAIPAESILTVSRPASAKTPAFLSGILSRVEAFPVHRWSSRIEVAGSGRLAVDAVYTALPTGSVLAALRDSLIGTVALVFLAGVILLVVAITEEDKPAPELAPEANGISDSLSEPSRVPDLSEEFQVPSFEIDSEPVDPEALAAGGLPENPQGLYSPRSGLGWESYLPERLEAELSRCASLGLDCALLLLECGPEAPYAEIASSIKDFFSFKDIAFERGRTGFAIVLPGKDLDEGLKAARDFAGRLPPGALIGLSGRSGRQVDAATVLQEAQAALDRAGTSGDSPVVGFKADPERYRDYVSGKL